MRNLTFLVVLLLSACATPKPYLSGVRLAALSTNTSTTVPVRYRVAAGTIAQYALVKVSTTTQQVTTLLHTDAGGLMTGIAMSAGTVGVAIPVQEALGYEVNVISDGTGAIAVGDLVDLSSTVDGEVMKAVASPTPDGNTICTATTAAAATPGTVFQCL